MRCRFGSISLFFSLSSLLATTMTGQPVYDLNAPGDETGGKVRLHQPPPPVPLRLGDLGISVARQVHQIDLLVNEKIVDLAGLTGRVPHPGKVFSAQQAVDD